MKEVRMENGEVVDADDGEEPTCAICGGPIPDEYDKFDDDAPVYADEFVYHLGCEDGVFEEVYAEADEDA